MAFDKRKMEDARKTEADKETAGRRATDAQVLEDAERLIADWNERQANRMPMLFAPTIGAASRPALVAMGAVSGLPRRQCDRPAHPRPSSRCSDHEPYSGAVVSPGDVARDPVRFIV